MWCTQKTRAKNSIHNLRHKMNSTLAALQVGSRLATVRTIRVLVSSLALRGLDEIGFKFYHTLDNLSETSNDCSVNKFPSDFVFQEAEVQLKGISGYIKSLLTVGLSSTTNLSHLTSSFGWSPVRSLYKEISSVNHTEAGGGSGIGVQMICDGRLVLTAGGGGGSTKTNFCFNF